MLVTIGSSNSLFPAFHLVIKWINADLLSIQDHKKYWIWEKNIGIFIKENAFENIVCKMSGMLLCVIVLYIRNG